MSIEISKSETLGGRGPWTSFASYNALWGYFHVLDKKQKGQRDSWTSALITQLIHEWAETPTQDTKAKSGFISPHVGPP